MPPRSSLLSALLLLLAFPAVSLAGDAEALLALKAALDRSNRLPWWPDTAAQLCASWPGVRQCGPGGRVTKLVLERLNLAGDLSAELLAPLRELRVLSFKSNSLTGAVPDGLAAALPNLKSLYLSDNRLAGGVPASLAGFHRIKVIALSGNRFAGAIPRELAAIPRLTSLLLDNNRLTGAIPAFAQPSLRLFNVSGNRLSGEIPATRALSQFNSSSFLPNAGLCGVQVGIKCHKSPIFGSPTASPGPVSSFAIGGAFPPLISSDSGHSKKRPHRAAIIAGATIAGVVAVAILAAAAAMLGSRRGKNKRVAGDRPREAAAAAFAGGDSKAAMPEHEHHNATAQEGAPRSRGGGGGFSWEAEGIGKLVFCGGVGEMYSLEELLRASAETLGRGAVGSTYKAVMETGFIVTVKRLRDSGDGAVTAGEFRRRAEELGTVRHPNVVPLRAYFQAKEERLLAYDYFPNGSLFSLIHGSRPSSKGKPLHWTSCMKIAEDIAAGLVHLHQSPPGGIVHGNLKPSNVLLGPDFESCLTDYGLVPALLSSTSDLASGNAPSSSSLFYRAPEARLANASAASFTAAADVYSFGVLLLELLTGKMPFQDLVELHGDDIPNWVRAVREEETESGGESASAGGAEEKLGALISIAAACVVADAARRPTTPEVLRMVREARAEAMSSSNSSDRSPGRWSDAVLGLPREHGVESFAERD